ncbi:hypothetical protein ACFYX5_31945 [Streptomyces rubiginosohelvolus]|uniref:hypothetical protein n=1 Tax=Streptomyces rubiginosohelvolus TaxID=67362 RepID=UPI0036AA4B8B
MSGADRMNDALHHGKGSAKESLGKGMGNEELAAEGTEEVENVHRRSNPDRQQGYGGGDNTAGRSKASSGQAGRHEDEPEG